MTDQHACGYTKSGEPCVWNPTFATKSLGGHRPRASRRGGKPSVESAQSNMSSVGRTAHVIARTGTVGRDEVVEALLAFVGAERASASVSGERAYWEWWGSEDAARHRGTIRRYAEQLGDASLEEMQAALCDLLDGPPFEEDRFVAFVASSVVNGEWDGIGPWRM